MTETDRSKFAIALLVIALASGLLWVGRLDGAQWVSAVTWTVAAYILGQVGAVVATGWTAQAVARVQNNVALK